MVCLIEGCERSRGGVGAKIRRSNVKRSHQKTSEQLKSVACRMLEMSMASVLLNRFLLLPLR